MNLKRYSNGYLNRDLELKSQPESRDENVPYQLMMRIFFSLNKKVNKYIELRRIPELYKKFLSVVFPDFTAYL